MSSGGHRTLTKIEAITLAQQIGARQAGADLGIHATLLRSWVKDAKTEGTDAFRGHGNRTAEETELERLRREIVVLKQEREILKKAAEFWVKEKGRP